MNKCPSKYVNDTTKFITKLQLTDTNNNDDINSDDNKHFLLVNNNVQNNIVATTDVNIVHHRSALYMYEVQLLLFDIRYPTYRA